MTSNIKTQGSQDCPATETSPATQGSPGASFEARMATDRLQEADSSRRCDAAAHQHSRRKAHAAGRIHCGPLPAIAAREQDHAEPRVARAVLQTHEEGTPSAALADQNIALSTRNCGGDA